MLGNDNYEEEVKPGDVQTIRNKRLVFKAIIICVLLLVAVILGIAYFVLQDQNTLKLYVNGQRIPITNTMIVEENGIRYVAIKEIAELSVNNVNVVGYQYLQAKYNDYSGTTSGEYFHVKNAQEAASFSANSKELTKNIIGLSNSIEEEENYELAAEVKKFEGNPNSLYISVENLKELFNMYVNNTDKRIYLYTLDYMETAYAPTITSYGYGSISQDYKNKRAMAYGLIVGMTPDGKYGVIDINMVDKISPIYTGMEFVQNTMSFFVEANGKTGLVTDQNQVIIPANEYDKISVLDEKQKLYIVYKNNLSGVLNDQGQIIIHPEYDAIGFDISEFKNDKLKNGKILFNKCIPVKKDGKWGIYNIGIGEPPSIVFDSLGYVKNSTDTSFTNSILVIPSSEGFEGIIVCKDNKYGLITTTGKLSPCSNDKIFSETRNGQTKYYMEFYGQRTEVSEWARAANFIETQSTSQNNTNIIEDNEEPKNEIQNEVIEIVDNNLINSNLVTNENTNTNENIITNTNTNEIANETVTEGEGQEPTDVFPNESQENVVNSNTTNTSGALESILNMFN